MRFLCSYVEKSTSGSIPTSRVGFLKYSEVSVFDRFSSFSSFYWKQFHVVAWSNFMSLLGTVQIIFGNTLWGTLRTLSLWRTLLCHCGEHFSVIVGNSSLSLWGTLPCHCGEHFPVIVGNNSLSLCGIVPCQLGTIPC